MSRFEYKVVVDGSVELTTRNSLFLFLYAWGREHHDLTHNNALTMANVAEMMYLKDSNPTPLGELADYVAENYERLSRMESRYDMLADFYGQAKLY